MTKVNLNKLFAAMFFASFFLLGIKQGHSEWSWFPLNSGTNTNLNSLAFVNAKTGYICGDSGVVLKTTNGGLNWTIFNTGTTYQFRSISFANANTGVVTGLQGSVRTTNGGATWIDMPFFYREKVMFTDSLTAYAVSSGQQVLKTTNGGANWVFKNVASVYSFYSLWFANSLTGYCGSGSPLVYKTTDGGDSWTTSNGAPLNYSMSFGNVNTGYTTGGEAVYRTINGGNNWQQILGPSTPNGYTSLNFINPRTGFLLTGPDTISIILRTGNMGNNWDTSYVGPESLFTVRFVTRDTAYCVGWHGVILKTIRGGKRQCTVSGSVTYKDNGQPVDSGYVKALYYDYETAQIITEDSAAIQPGGTYVLPHVPQDTLDIMFYQNDGEDGLNFVPTYYVSTIDWTQATKIYTSQNLTNINAQVYRISNPGSNFSISGMVMANSYGESQSPLRDAIIYVQSGNAFKSYGVSGLYGNFSANKLPAGSYNLVAYRMGYSPVSQNVTITNGSINNINFNFGDPIGVQPPGTELPFGFKLHQNYPNPFNPATIIKFEIPKAENVRITVYDITGRIVNILVNKELKAGSYSVNWNASLYASGVYFYRIETKDFTQTKKMLLLK